jgi:D-tagatose-1,6-bisphosphate aldolase subunit GatZ/KbaZ
MPEHTSPPTQALLDLVKAQKQGQPAGIYSVCSANHYVIEACMQQALADGSPLLIESSSNQVNQYGGYSGLDPSGFAASLRLIARRMGFPWERLILGGDHLGPNPWEGEPAASAIEKARQLVSDSVRAGYGKIHLDASMRLGGDNPSVPLDQGLAASRTAELCQASEEAAIQIGATWKPLYVIGTEVPLPGGALDKASIPQVTRVSDARLTLEITQEAFASRGLQAAWERVIAQVVHPGVEYGDDFIYPYDPASAANLSDFIHGYAHLVFEAHSTDYQSPEALRQMVRDHFAILKVGPALTFALREAVFSLAAMECEYLPAESTSHVPETLEQAMRADPTHWKKYYHGSPEQVALARKYSYSDRIRYYWSRAEVERALAQLIQHLEANPPPLTLVSQYLPLQYKRIREGLIRNTPTDLIYDKIKEVISGYAYACGL